MHFIDLQERTLIDTCSIKLNIQSMLSQHFLSACSKNSCCTTGESVLRSRKYRLALIVLLRPFLYFLGVSAGVLVIYRLTPQLHASITMDEGMAVSLLLAVAVFIIAAWRQCVTLSDAALNDVLNHSSIAAMKALFYITENASHELSTPLEVIVHKVAKIQRKMQEILDREISAWEQERSDGDIIARLPQQDKIALFMREHREDVCVKDVAETLQEISYIVTASEQIGNILRRMRGFKSIKYSNGDKTFYDVAKAALETLAITHGRLQYRIDERLQCFGNPDGKLTNADLLSILINHVKNSIEAGATLIAIKLHEYRGSYICIDIEDNGSGIPEELREYVFEPNITSKGNAGIRGNGMYINRQILRSVGGDVKIISTGKGGTIIRLRIPSERRCKPLRKGDDEPRSIE